MERESNMFSRIRLQIEWEDTDSYYNLNIEISENEGKTINKTVLSCLKNCCKSKYSPFCFGHSFSEVGFSHSY